MTEKKTDSSENKNPSLADALGRLNDALDGLEAAAEASVNSRDKMRSTDEEVQRMADDRTKLARDLDSAEAKAERLAQANNEVSRRLVGAMEMVRGVLDKTA